MINLASNFGYLGIKEDNLKVSETIINQTAHEEGIPTRTFWGMSPYRHDRTVRNQIHMAYEAYSMEGIIKQVIDKFSEQFRDFDLEGGPKQVKYLKSRLHIMGIQSGEDWKTLISRGINEYIKTGNLFFLKYRGWGPETAQRPLYKNRPYTLSSWQIFSAARLNTHYNEDNIFDGWVISDLFSHEKMNLVAPGATKLDESKALVNVQPVASEPYVYVDNADLAHITYKRGANTRWGQGMILAGLEDWSLLRGLELNVAVMLKKFSMPLLHHKIKRILTPLAGVNNEIREANQLYQRRSPDGVIITTDNHEITPVGSESQAIRSEGYLEYFMTRAIASIGSSPYLVGTESGGDGAIGAAKEDMLTRVRWMQTDLARQLKFHLFDEILWEGGFDPFRNEKDEVHLTFGDVDADATIKKEAHAADMFTKNAIDHDQLQSRIKNKKPVNESKLYSNMIAKPEAEHSAKVGADAQVKVEKSKPKPAKAREQIVNLLPTCIEELDDFILLMSNKFGYDKDEFYHMYDSMTELIDDPDAFMELLVQSLTGD